MVTGETALVVQLRQSKRGLACLTSGSDEAMHAFAKICRRGAVEPRPAPDPRVNHCLFMRGTLVCRLAEAASSAAASRASGTPAIDLPEFNSMRSRPPQPVSASSKSLG